MSLHHTKAAIKALIPPIAARRGRKALTPRPPPPKLLRIIGRRGRRRAFPGRVFVP